MSQLQLSLLGEPIVKHGEQTLTFSTRKALALLVYLAAYAAKSWGLPPELAVGIGTATAAALGLVGGGIAIRRQGIYFAMITLALANVMRGFCRSIRKISAPTTT